MLIYIRQYILDDLKLMDNSLRNILWSLRCEPFLDKLHEVMELTQFEDIVESVLTFQKESDEELNYLKKCFFASVISFCNM